MKVNNNQKSPIIKNHQTSKVTNRGKSQQPPKVNSRGCRGSTRAAAPSRAPAKVKNCQKSPIEVKVNNYQKSPTENESQQPSKVNREKAKVNKSESQQLRRARPTESSCESQQSSKVNDRGVEVGPEQLPHRELLRKSTTVKSHQASEVNYHHKSTIISGPCSNVQSWSVLKSQLPGLR